MAEETEIEVEESEDGSWNQITVPEDAGIKVEVSDEDVKEKHWDYFASKVKYVAVTSGFRGVFVSIQGQWNHVPGFSTNILDSTGAGDVWASTFMIFFYETRDIILSSKMANSAASLSIEGLGYSNIPGRKKIQEKIAKVNSD